MKSRAKKTAFLLEELREYEKTTDMTAEERAALHKWVSEGNSVHENGSMGCYENGSPMDFLDDYRYQEEIWKDLEQLAPAERENYIARLRGVDTVETLQEDLSMLSVKAEAYRRVLKKHGWLAEAEALMDSWKANEAAWPEMDAEGFPFQQTGGMLQCQR